ncbi:MAG: hypothetical protein HOW73_23395 [Polyangiaceae bacterium]|nr:hypothetical protein [Polyangiaceae bacterium]
MSASHIELRGSVAALLGLYLFAAACSDSGDSSGGGGAGDGLLHPPGNGTEVDETSACETMRDALADGANELGCVATFRTCPGLLRALQGEDCASYDEGSVAGCVDYYAEAADCDDLTARADHCGPESIGNPPAGCPE